VNGEPNRRRLLGGHLILEIITQDLIKFVQFKSNVSTKYLGIFIQNSPRAIKEVSKETEGSKVE
jgi:hypothetical protein